jgi:hypothetical protein
MPISLQISHPDRMVIGVIRGVVTGEDLYQFTAELAAAGAGRYRKIIDVIGHTAGLTAEEIAAFSARMHAAPPTTERGPIALVADRETGALSELFARLMGDQRPVRVFRSIHAAREWLQANTEYL